MAIQQQKKKTGIVEFFQKNKTILLLGAIVFFLVSMWGGVQLILIIALAIPFIILGAISLQVSRMVPHISIETVTGAAIVMGYLFGWRVGLWFGILAGIIGYVKIGLIKLTTIVNALFMGLCGVLAAFFHGFGYSFYLCYLFTFIIRANIGFLVFKQLNPDLFENIMHSYGDGAFNVLITVHLMQLVVNVVQPFV